MVLSFLLVIFLLFPFLFIIVNFRAQEFPEWSEIFWALKNTLFQASLSSFFSVILGMWAAGGLIALKNSKFCKFEKIVQQLCLAPNFLPVIFIILSVFSVVEPFPMGIFGIVVIHTILNFGLVAMAVYKIAELKFGAFAEISLVEGSSRFHFLTRVFIPLIKRDLLLIYIFVFTICFGSFAVPLVVGGGRGTTLEVLMYEKIRLSADWGGAALIAILQSSFIYLFSLVSLIGKELTQQRPGRLDLLSFKSGLLPVFGVLALIFFGYAKAVIEGLDSLSSFDGMSFSILTAAMGTIFVGVFTSVIAYLFLMWSAFIFPAKPVDIFLSGYVAPSTALAGFSFLIIFPNTDFWIWCKIPIVIVIISFTTLYRMGWRQSLESTLRQCEVATVLGANPWQVFREVKMPQIHSRAIDLVAIIGIWASGDFAVSRIIGERDFTLAMLTETLMSGYRLPQAAVLSVGLILASIVVVLIVKGGGRVLSRKLSL